MEISIKPELMIALALLPNQFHPLRFQVPPLLNVALVMLNGVALNVDVPSETLPDMVPELLTVTPPVLVELMPLLTATAVFRLLVENRFAVTFFELAFSMVAPCELLLLI